MAAAKQDQFDHHSSEHAANAECIYRELRELGGVSRSDLYGGFFVLGRYSDITTIARDHETFSSARNGDDNGPGTGGVTIPPNPATRMSLDEMDPPEWKRIRSALNPPFSPASISKLEPLIGQLDSYLLDRVIESGSADLVLDLANPLPAIVTLDMLGFPKADWEPYADPLHKMVHVRRDQPEYEEVLQGTLWILEQIRTRIADCRRSPGNDLVSYLVHHDGGGTPFTDPELEEMVFLVMAGGIDTTTALLANTFVYLDENPDDRRRLQADPTLIASACEEALRVFTPIQALARNVTKTTEIHGVEMHAGDRVLLAWASANRDPDQFPDPDEVRLDRFPNRHCSFGIGIHRCLGSNLARTVYKITVGSVLRRLPDYQVVSAGAHRYDQIGTINGWEHVPVTFTPGAREDAVVSL